MKGQRNGSVRGGIVAMVLAAVAAIAWLALVSEAQAGRRSSVTSKLHATAAEPGANGDVRENVEESPTGSTVACCVNGLGEQGCSDLTSADCAAMNGTNLGAGSTCGGAAEGQDPCGDSQACANEPDGQNNDLRGGLVVAATGLAPRAKFGVSVGGVQLGMLRTNARGRGRKRFRGRKLTVDPRGRRIAVTNAADAEVLVGVVSDPTAPCGIACCLSTAEEQGCADVTAADCTAVGGVATATGRCDADPCADSSPNGAFIDG